ncbi:hypothetical protein K8942_02975 [Candidatus Peribacteria bacterium]|nr:MAG: hypothetical protein K8942_02975 [Candidatus Peribacteria bacterium]
MHLRPIVLAVLLLTVLSACFANTPVTGDTESTASTPTLTVTPNNQAKDTEHGEMMNLAIGALTGANGTLANGVATAYEFEDGSTNIGVQLNIATAKEGTVYDAWLEDAAGKRLPIGTLENTAGDVRHYARLTTKAEIKTYRNVVILLRQKNDAPDQGQVIATGILKDSAR